MTAVMSYGKRFMVNDLYCPLPQFCSTEPVIQNAKYLSASVKSKKDKHYTQPIYAPCFASQLMA